MNNSSLFTTFASQIFGELYENFPIPVVLPKKDIIEAVESHDEFWKIGREVSTVIGIIEIFEAAGKMTPELRAKAEQKQRNLTTQRDELALRLRRVDAVFDGTVDFLLQEEFIRSADEASYQLTLKGFTHLNKRFLQVGITDGPSLIEKIHESLRPENFSGAVIAGTFSNLIPKVFGG